MNTFHNDRAELILTMLPKVYDARELLHIS